MTPNSLLDVTEDGIPLSNGNRKRSEGWIKLLCHLGTGMDDFSDPCGYEDADTGGIRAAVVLIYKKRR